MIVGPSSSRKASRRYRGLALVWTCAAALGCQASVQGEVSTGKPNHGEPDPFARLDDPEPSTAPSERASLTELDSQLGSTRAPLALLGARHDLSLTAGATPNCSCMAFAVGHPTDARFTWEDERPTLPNEDSVVVAFSMVEGECPAEQVASYRGYEVVGNNVRLLVEQAVEGRPRLTGAVVPRPMPGGSFVVSAPQDAPFGHSRQPTESDCVLLEGASADGATASTPASSAAGEQSKGFARGEVEPDQEVPTSEEFAATPDEVPLDDGPHSERAGFHMALLLGAEYPIADVNVGNGLSAHSASALGMGFDVYVGGNQNPDMAVGLALGGASAPDPQMSTANDTSLAESVAAQSGWELNGTTLVLRGTQMNLFRIGGFVDYYFSADSNWHALLMLGYANLSFSGGRVDESLQGFTAHAGLGYDFWLSHHWSLGVMGRLLWSPMSSSVDDATVHLISPSLALSLTFH